MTRRMHTLLEFTVFDTEPVRALPPPPYDSYELAEGSSVSIVVPADEWEELENVFASVFELERDPEDTAVNVPPPWAQPGALA